MSFDVYNNELQIAKSNDAYAAGKATSAGEGISKHLVTQNGNSFAKEFAIKHAQNTNAGTYNSNMRYDEESELVDETRDADVKETDDKEEENYEAVKADSKKIEDRLTGQDIEDIADTGIDIGAITVKQLDKIVDSIKQMRQDSDIAIENQVERIKTVAKQFDDMAKLSDDDVKQLLRAADIPVTAANVSKLSHTLEMSSVIPDITDDAKAFMIEHGTALTIAQFYRASYSSMGAVSNGTMTDEVFESLRGSISNIATTDKDMTNARWLLDHNLAVNESTLGKINDINNIVNDYSTKNAVSFITDTMSQGEDPATASLLRMRAGMTFQAMAAIDARNAAGADNGLSEILKGMNQLRMQLLDDLFGIEKELKNLENELLPDEITDLSMLEQATSVLVTNQATMEERSNKLYEQYNIAVKTMTTIWTYSDLKVADGESALQVDASIYGKDVNINNVSNALNRYDEGQTQVRADLGDSMKKAFAGIESLLTSQGIEPTSENVAATKLLGYASLEVNNENVESMKAHMLKVSSTFEALKPAVVVQMVKSGINTLDMDFDELRQTANQIANQIGATKEEKYSEYLYRLEQNSQINEKEREAYIGIYRLIKAVEGTDNAAIATTVKAGREFTMANLLSSVRTLRGNGIDANVDDEFGGIDAIIPKGTGIDEQIKANLSATVNEIDLSEEELQYKNMLVSKTGENLEKGFYIQPGVDNIANLVDTNLENLAFVDNSSSDNNVVENMYLESISENVTKESVELLKGNEMSLTIENIALANDYIKSDSFVLGRLNSRNARISLATESTVNSATQSIGDRMLDILLEGESDALTKLNESYSEALDTVENELSKEVLKQNESAIAKELVMDINRVSFARQLMNNQVYELPLTDENGNEMNIRMTLKSGDESKVLVALSTTTIGRIKMSATADNNEIYVTVLSDLAKGVDTIKDRGNELVDALTDIAGTKVNINYARMQIDEAFSLNSMTENARMQGNVDSKGGVNGATRMDTKKLCQMASTLIDYIRKVC